MKRKYLKTLAALILLGVLWGSITIWQKRKGREVPKTESTPVEKILAVESSHVQSFSLRPREGQAVTCRREGGRWVIVEPQKLAADQSSISSLLNSLTGADVDQVVDPHPPNLKDFGLDPSAFALEVSTDARPAKFTLSLGDETPTSGGVYAQVAGNPRVLTLASYLKTSLEKNLFDLRDKRAHTLDADHLQRIEAVSKDKHWTLVKNPEGVWDLALPPPVRADRAAVDGLVDRLRGLSMQTVAAEDKKKTGEYGFGSPSLRVTLTGQGGSQTIVLGKKDKEGDRYFAMNSALEPVFTLGSDFLTQLQKDPADLREKSLFSFSSFEAKHVEVDTPKGHRVFEQQGNKWKQTAPSTKDVPSDKMETILNRLTDLRADSFPKNHPENLAAFGLANPAYKFQVKFGDKNQLEIVDVSKVGDHVYARRSTDPAACELSKTALEDFEKALSAL